MDWNPNNEWLQHAACRGMDTNIFFPNRGQSGNNVNLARATCRECPVRQQCLDFALSAEDDHYGIFAGYTATERRQVRRLLKENPGVPFFNIVGVEKMKFRRTR